MWLHLQILYNLGLNYHLIKITFWTTVAIAWCGYIGQFSTNQHSAFVGIDTTEGSRNPTVGCDGCVRTMDVCVLLSVITQCVLLPPPRHMYTLRTHYVASTLNPRVRTYVVILENCCFLCRSGVRD